MPKSNAKGNLIRSLTLHYADGSEKTLDVDSADHEMTMIENIKVVICLFCGQKKTLTYSNSLLVNPLKAGTCNKCGSVYYFTSDPELCLKFAETRFSPLKIDKLKGEEKIRTRKLIQANPTNETVYQLQIFPLTDWEMEWVFTDNQIQALNHRLAGKKLERNQIQALYSARKMQKRTHTRWKILSLIHI